MLVMYMPTLLHAGIKKIVIDMKRQIQVPKSAEFQKIEKVMA